MSTHTSSHNRVTVRDPAAESPTDSSTNDHCFNFSHDKIPPGQSFQDSLRKHRELLNMKFANNKEAAHFKERRENLYKEELKENTEGIALEDKLARLKTELEARKSLESAKVAEAKREITLQKEKNQRLREKRTDDFVSLSIRRKVYASYKNGDEPVSLFLEAKEDEECTTTTINTVDTNNNNN